MALNKDNFIFPRSVVRVKEGIFSPSSYNYVELLTTTFITKWETPSIKEVAWFTKGTWERKMAGIMYYREEWLFPGTKVLLRRYEEIFVVGLARNKTNFRDQPAILIKNSSNVRWVILKDIEILEDTCKLNKKWNNIEQH